MVRSPAASQRFKDYDWLAQLEAKRACKRGFLLTFDELLAAARIGLWETDRRAGADVEPKAFAAWASTRCRGAILDALREALHGSRRGTAQGAVKPRMADPMAMGMARDQGLLPRFGIERDDGGEGDDWIGVALEPGPGPEAQLLKQEEQREARRRIAEAPMVESWKTVLTRRLNGDDNLKIARDLGVSEVRTSQMLRDGLDRIRKTHRD